MKRKTSLERSFETVSFREPQNENNFKKDKTLVDPVFKKNRYIYIKYYNRKIDIIIIYLFLIHTFHEVNREQGTP